MWPRDPQESLSADPEVGVPLPRATIEECGVFLSRQGSGAL